MRKIKDVCLAESHPHLVELWHPTKNGELTPYNVGRGSEKIVWWICFDNKEHIYQAMIKSRSLSVNPKCLICCANNKLAITHPHLLKEWHPTKNGNLLFKL